MFIRGFPHWLLEFMTLSPLKNDTMLMFKRMPQEQRVMLEITVAVERLMQKNGNLMGRMCQVIYETTRRRCCIVKELQVKSSNRVATHWLQGSIRGYDNKIRCEKLLKTTSSKAKRRVFEDWVEILNKGLKILDVFLAIRKLIREIVCKRSSYSRTRRSYHVLTSCGCSGPERSWSASRGHDY